MRHKRLKNSSIETGNIIQSTKIDETQQSQSFSETPRLLCSTTSPYDRDICILCDKTWRKTRQNCFKRNRKKMLDIAKKLYEKDLLIRLYSVLNVSDAVADGVKYHLICWAQFQGKLPSENDDTIQVIDNIDTVIADIKTIKFIENALRKNVHTFSDMNNFKYRVQYFIRI